MRYKFNKTKYIDNIFNFDLTRALSNSQRCRVYEMCYKCIEKGKTLSRINNK